MGRHDLHTREILLEFEAGRPVSQRALSRKLGIALGLTNLLVRRIIQKGWAKTTQIKPNRVSYLITPAGIREKTRITRLYFENTIRLYSETRTRIRENLDKLSAKWPAEDLDGHGQKRVVFYGAGEVAEIGYVSLQGTDLTLVGVVDDFTHKRFFGLPVHLPEDLTQTDLNGVPYSRIVIMSIRKASEIRARLKALGIPPERVVTL